jgi:RhoGEF domain
MPEPTEIIDHAMNELINNQTDLLNYLKVLEASKDNLLEGLESNKYLSAQEKSNLKEMFKIVTPLIDETKILRNLFVNMKVAYDDGDDQGLGLFKDEIARRSRSLFGDLNSYMSCYEMFESSRKANPKAFQSVDASFRTVFEQMDQNENIQEQSLDTVLSKPSQAITRYTMPFMEMIKHMPEDEPSTKQIREIQEVLQDRALDVNERKGARERKMERATSSKDKPKKSSRNVLKSLKSPIKKLLGTSKNKQKR